ncbi:MAG: EAL domain-containing protein [Lachnospiraceae bacterium]|nr:EAL domain-containing protein [Lachnospiraceae bacterium]
MNIQAEFVQGDNWLDNLNLLLDSVFVGFAQMRYEDGLIIEHANDTLNRMMEAAEKALSTKLDGHYDKLLDESDWKKLEEKIKKCSYVGESFQEEYCIRSAAYGSEEWCMMQAVVSKMGEHPVFQCVITDITEAKRALSLFEQEHAKSELILQLAGDLFFEYDVENDRMVYSKRGEETINPNVMEEVYIGSGMLANYVHPEDMDRLQEFYTKLSNCESNIHVELRKKYTDGLFHWIAIDARGYVDPITGKSKVVGKSQNIDDRVRAERLVREQAEKDSLTGLLNHMTVRQRIDEELHKIKPADEWYIMIADVDDFKGVNDVNGHLYGDAVLCNFADQLQSLFPEAIKGRIGGDEFIMLIKDMNRSQVEEAVENIRASFQKLYKDKQGNLTITCSYGLVLCNAKRTADELFHWADCALYRVKNSKKGAFLIVEPTDVLPKIEKSHLKDMEEEYQEKQSLLNSPQDLIPFTLELLDNVADLSSGLKIVSDRVCKYFDFDDVTLVRQNKGMLRKSFHWNNGSTMLLGDQLRTDAEDWAYINEQFDDQGVMVLRKGVMEQMKGRTMGSILFVKVDSEQDENGFVAFIDREKDRDWENEKEVLVKFAFIIFNRIQKLIEDQQTKIDIDRKLNYDALTGLPNYSRFMQMSAEYVEQHPNANLYFVYSDFSNFQFLNEMHGYMAGDSVLKKYADALVNQCPNGIMHTRITSDKFISLLEWTDEQAEIDSFLKFNQEFCKSVNNSYEKANVIIISGVCPVSSAQNNVSTALDLANIARKHAKTKGDTTVFLFDENVRKETENEMYVVSKMASALENQEFVAFVQPKVSLETGKVIGGEALVRWISKDGTMVYPNQFIPVFEKNGFITKVDFCVYEQILKYLKDALILGEEVVPISINFSRKHLETPDFIENMRRYMKDYAVPAKFIEAEITESVFVMELDELKERIDEVHNMGISVAIDDFGSGYSSLNVLAQIPADVIKLDKKFFDFDTGKARQKQFIKYLIRMMKHMGVMTVMEGVETEEQVSFMKKCGCDAVQGYYYAKPMPLSEFRKFIRDFNDNVSEPVSS